MLSTLSTSRWPATLGLIALAMALFTATFLASSNLQRLSAPSAPTTAQRSDIGRDAASATDRQIGTLQERLRQKPDDQPAATRLGLSYLQRARETSDPTYYSRAEGILQQALTEAADDTDTLIGL